MTAPTDGSLVLDLDDRLNLRDALRKLEQAILDVTADCDPDGSSMRAIAGAARVFRWELHMDDLESGADHG